MNKNLPNTKKTKNPNIKKLKVLITIVNRSKALFYTDLLEQYAFVAMIFNAIENAMTIKLDALIMRAICNMIGETVYDDPLELLHRHLAVQERHKLAVHRIK